MIRLEESVCTYLFGLICLLCVSMGSAAAQIEAGFGSGEGHLSPVEEAFQVAMDKDPTFNVDDKLTMTAAVEAWEEFLRREDTTNEQRLFAKWTVGQLLTTHWDPERGDMPDYKKGCELLGQVMDGLPELLCREKFNAATLYGTQPGTSFERALAMAKSYGFLMSCTEEQAEKSAGRINSIGYCVPGKFFPHYPVEEGVSEEELLGKRVQWAKTNLHDSQELITGRITEFLKTERTEENARLLLNQVRDVAPVDVLEAWQNIMKEHDFEHSDFGDTDDLDALTNEIIGVNLAAAEGVEDVHKPRESDATVASAATDLAESRTGLYAVFGAILVVAISGVAWSLHKRRTKKA